MTIILIGQAISFTFGQDMDLLLQRLFYVKVDTGWELTMQEDYTYDVQKRLVKMVAFRKDGEEWSNHMKNEYRYPDSKSDTSRIEISYEGGDGEWGLPYRSIYFIDSDGFENRVLMQDYNPLGHSWVTIRKGDIEKRKFNRNIMAFLTHPVDNIFFHFNLFLLADYLHISIANGFRIFFIEQIIHSISLH